MSAVVFGRLARTGGPLGMLADMGMTPQRWEAIIRYGRELGPDPNPQLASLMERAVAAGLPPIAVSSDVGRLLFLLASLAASSCGDRGPLALELGTLAGYSGVWLARGLGPRGRLITVEPNGLHADFAQREFDAAGVGARVTIRRDEALKVLPAISGELGVESLDLAFVDAVKTEYPQYVGALRPLIRSGGLLVIDNALGTDRFCTAEPLDATPPERRADHQAVDRANRMVAEDPGFVATLLPIREGVLIARKVAQ